MSHHEDEEEDVREEPARGVRESRIPEWAKLALAGFTGAILVIGWTEVKFVTRQEWANHLNQQQNDLDRMVRTQEGYGLAERSTSANLSAINARLSGIESKVEILLSQGRPTITNGHETR